MTKRCPGSGHRPTTERPNMAWANDALVAEGYKFGVCPDCAGTYILRRDGRVAAHKVRGDGV